MTAPRPYGWRLNRRPVLGAGLAPAGVALLGNYGGSNQQPSAQSTKVHAKQGTATPLTWETYYDKPWLTQCTDTRNVQIDAVPVGSVDETSAKVQAGSVNADIFYFDSSTSPRHSKAALIARTKVGAVIRYGQHLTQVA